MTAQTLSEPHKPDSAAFRADEPLDIRHLVIVQPGTVPVRGDGVHHAAKCLAMEQAHRGDEARIYFLSAPEDKDNIVVPPVPSLILPLKGWRFMGHHFDFEPDLADAIIAGASDRTIFHLHGGRFLLWSRVARLLRARGLPYAITIHGRYAHAYDAQQRLIRQRTGLFVGLFDRSVLEGAKFVHALSQAEHDCIRRIAPKAQVELVLNGGFSSARDGLPPRPKRMRSDLFPHFGFCGRLAIEHKGLDLLLQGFAQYRSRKGRGRLSVVGPGERQELLALAEELGLGEAFHLGQPIYGADKARLVASWDYFVMPSRFDSGPLAALEAAVEATPLLLSENTGLSADLRRFGAGLAFPELTPAHIAGTMLSLDDDAEDAWRARSSNAFDMGLELGDWTRNVERLRALYLR